MTRFVVFRVRRALAALLLLAAQLALGISIHHHSSNVFDSVDRDEPASTRLIHEVDCTQPTASHWHRDRVVEVEPCLACLRQHLVGIEAHAPVRPILTIVHTAGPIPSRMPVPGFRLEPTSRGPPTLL